MDRAPPQAHTRVVSEAHTPREALRALLIKGAGIVLGAFAIFFVLMVLFKEQVLAVASRFVAIAGGPGIAAGFFVPDAFTIPIPNDAFTTFGILAGMPFWEVVFWGSLGSVLGGIVGYGIGWAFISENPKLKAYLDERGEGILTKVQTGGTVALGIAAVTPLPYSLACWSAGALKIPFGRFVAVSLLRIPRVAATLWLIQLGVLAI